MALHHARDRGGNTREIWRTRGVCRGVEKKSCFSMNEYSYLLGTCQASRNFFAFLYCNTEDPSFVARRENGKRGRLP